MTRLCPELEGHNFCDDHPVLIVFGKSATPMQFFKFPAWISPT